MQSNAIWASQEGSTNSSLIEPKERDILSLIPVTKLDLKELKVTTTNSFRKYKFPKVDLPKFDGFNVK